MATFVKKPLIPETDVSKVEGSAKRNIHRKGPKAVGRKDDVPGNTLGDTSTYDEPAALDENDPNFDSEEDAGYSVGDRALMREDVGRAKLTLSKFKKTVEPLISEFFIHGDTTEIIQSIQDIGCSEYNYEFVKRLVNMSFDKSDRERELVSKLLSKAYPNFLSSNTIGKGFERIFELIDEIEKDALNARDLLAVFLARAVLDEVLPPAFLSDAVICNLGGEIIEHAKRMLSRDHGGAKLECCWGPGDGRPVEELKVALDLLLQEYLLSNDIEEAGRCIYELNAPHFYHEVVKRAVVTALDKSPAEQLAMSSLLAYLMERDILTKKQAEQGFNRLHGMIGELSLDVPSAGESLVQFTARAKEDAVLSPDYSPTPLQELAAARVATGSADDN